MAKQGVFGGIHISQETHFKMSKKIAQLTKVIYALHTKNDEFETIANLERVAHEEELEQLSKQAQSRVEALKDAISREGEYRMRIEALETSVGEHERLRGAALASFASFKEERAREASRVERRHADEIRKLTGEVSAARAQFDARLVEFREIEAKRKEELDGHVAKMEERVTSERRKLEREVERRVRDFEEEHQRKIDEVVKRERNFKDKAIEETSRKWRDEVERVKEKLKVALEKAKLVKDGELEDLRRANGELQARISDLANVAEKKERDSSSFWDQLLEERKAGERLKGKLNEVEGELIAREEKWKQQIAELRQRAGELGRLQAQCHSQEGRIAKLQAELGGAHDRISFLEKENRRLAVTKDETTEEHVAKLRALERELEKLAWDKRELKAQYARELEAAQVRSGSREEELRESFGEEVRRLKESHEKYVANLRDEEARLRAKERELMEERLRAKVGDLESRIEDEVREKGKLEDEMRRRVKEKEEEVGRIRALVEQHEKGLGTAESHVNNLKTELNRLRNELESRRKELKEAEGRASGYLNQIKKLRVEHEKHVEDLMRQGSTERDLLAKQLDEKWSERLRLELSGLRNQLNKQYRDDSRQALDHLTKLKGEEMEEMRKYLKKQIAQLTEKIELMNRTRDELATKSSENEHLLKQKYEAELDVIRARANEEKRAHAEKTASLENSHLAFVEKLTQKHQTSLKALETRLLHNYDEEVLEQRKANRLAFDALKDQCEKRRINELEALEKDKETEMVHLRQVLVSENEAELEKQALAYREKIREVESAWEEKLNAIKQRLEEEKQIGEKQQMELRDRDFKLQSTTDELRNFKRNVTDLSRELQTKGEEILQARREAEQKIRRREAELSIFHEQEKLRLNEEREREVASVMYKLNETRVEMENRISDLQAQVYELEELYAARDSRPEDLDMIAQLQWAVNERDESIQRLSEEKRVFELELINREDSYNRIFKVNPQVGVLDPLSSKRKKSGPRHVSAPTLAANAPVGVPTRLAPLPGGSPKHEHRLRKARPLPNALIDQNPVKSSSSTTAEQETAAV